MKIASSEMQMASTHASTQQHEIRESLRMWVGNQRPDFEGRGNSGNRPLSPPVSERVTLSGAGRAAQSAESNAIEDTAEAVDQDPRIRLLRAMIYMLTGKEARVVDPGELDSPPPAPDIPHSAPAAPQGSSTPTPPRPTPAGFGVEYDFHESYSESEQTTFSAAGVVHTADGKEISFTLNLTMSRSYYEETNVSLRLGDAVRQVKDPLILNFSGSAAQLSNQRFSFDLDTDGKADNINMLASGSGFLALDRNGDGKINDGSELFGAKSGDGFAELAALDGDSNGWIDENDAAYAELKVWTPDANGGGDLRGLKDANVGAVSLARIATPFSLRDSNNAPLGQVRSSSIFLQEDGRAGTIQQVDLSV
ncbi:MAG: VCBS repeat-containing protein [Rhodocyclaceae bacterium]